jgi:FdhD protein
MYLVYLVYLMYLMYPVYLMYLYDPRVSRVAIAAIRRLHEGGAETEQDLVAVEAPLSVTVRSAGGAASVPLGVTMRTPGDDRDLVLGLLYSERLIQTLNDIVSIEFTKDDDEAERATVEVAAGIDVDASVHRRAVVGTSACGLCGRLEVERLDVLARTAPARGDVTWPVALVASLPKKLQAGQAVFAETGGLHAAGLFAPDGSLIALREDVGRHNAVDKLIGSRLDAGFLPARDILLAVSGRVAYEIVQKAALAGVAGIVAVGAPSSLAIRAAQATGLTLAGFARDGRFNLYVVDHRVRGLLQ